MSAREQVVQMPEIVAMRRYTQAVYAELTELRRRQWGQSGTPGASYDTIGQTGRAIDRMTQKHRELTHAYEARVAREMRGPLASILRVYESLDMSMDLLLEVAAGEDLTARADREREERGADWAEFVTSELVLCELRVKLCQAAYLLGSDKEVHRAHGAKVRVAALAKAAALRLTLQEPTAEEMLAAGLLR